MLKEYIILLLLGVICFELCDASQSLENQNPREGKFAFLNGATNVISSLAQDLLSRSASSSQVLSLNLTNLVILLVLKAIIFGASSFGYGPSSYGRSSDNLANGNLTNEHQPRGLMSEDELIFMLTYLQADSTEKYECLHRTACENPSKAKEYLLAGKIFLKGTQLLSSTAASPKYSKILTGLQEAVTNGLNGGNCSTRYHCNINKNNQ